MKVAQLTLMFILLGLCAPSVYAQKQVKYLPKAFGTTSAFKKGLDVRRGVTLPHTPAFTQALERKVTAIFQSANREFLPHTNTPNYVRKNYTPRRTTEEVWEEVTQFMREHNGAIPKHKSADEYERQLRWTWDTIYQRKQSSNDPYAQRLIKLHEKTVREQAANKNPQEILSYVQRFMQENDGELPSPYTEDMIEKSYYRALVAFHQKYKELTPAQVEELEESSRTLEKLYRETVTPHKTPQQVLEYTTQFMQENDGKLPSSVSTDPVEKSYYKALANFHQKYKEAGEEELAKLDETSRQLEKLCRQTFKQYDLAKTPQQILDYATQFMREHDGKLPSQVSTDPVEKSYRKAWNKHHQKYKELSEEELKELNGPNGELELLFRNSVRKYNKKSAE